MNHIEVQGGGFPGTSLTWRFIRDMIKEVHELAVAMAGDNCIVTGCELNNGEVSPGVMIINGEAVPFAGGTLPANRNIEIAQSIQAADYFQDEEGDGQADSIDTYFTRYAQFGAAGVDYLTLKRLEPLSEVARRLPPKQVALPFWGAVNLIPKGWQLCDGSNGTPDLRGMFVAGYDPDDNDHNAPGKTGGSSKHTLTDSEMPIHKHSGTVNITHNHGYKDRYFAEARPDGALDGAEKLYTNVHGSADSDFDNDYLHYKNATTDYHSGFKPFTSNNAGGGEPHENRPKYYTMAWIAYVGE
jgi:microcystin-dependent protein